MRTICPKIFAKLDCFATISQTGVAYSAPKIFWAFLSFFQLCPSNSQNFGKLEDKTQIFRVKDNLAVILPYGQKFPRHNILVIIYN